MYDTGMPWRVLIVALSVATLNCDARHASNIERKARCASLGKSYIADLEKKFGGEPVIMNATFAYNSTADTCLCRYDAHWTAKGAGAYFTIVDLLSNKTLAYYDTTVPAPKVLEHYQTAVAAMDQDHPLPPMLPGE